MRARDWSAEVRELEMKVKTKFKTGLTRRGVNDPRGLFFLSEPVPQDRVTSSNPVIPRQFSSNRCVTVFRHFVPARGRSLYPRERRVLPFSIYRRSIYIYIIYAITNK